MMYILTQAEFDELKAKKETKLRLDKEKLQELCTHIAETMPITWSWGDKVPQPWGCHLTEGNSDWHCDECPVQTICPGPKSYSQ